MKVLFAIMMSMVITGTAFGACSTSSLGDCKTADECTGLSVKDGVQYVFPKDKCLVKEMKVAEDCLKVQDLGNKPKPAIGTTPGTTKPADNAQK